MASQKAGMCTRPNCPRPIPRPRPSIPKPRHSSICPRRNRGPRPRLL